MIGAVGGGAVLGIFDDHYSFGLYAIGLAGGFFGYLLISLLISRTETAKWMGGADVTEHVIVERRVVDNP